MARERAELREQLTAPLRQVEGLLEEAEEEFGPDVAQALDEAISGLDDAQGMLADHQPKTPSAPAEVHHIDRGE